MIFILFFTLLGSNLNLKKKIIPSLYKEDPEEELQAEKDKKSSRGKKRRRKKAKISDVNIEALNDNSIPPAKKSKTDSNDNR